DATAHPHPAQVEEPGAVVDQQLDGLPRLDPRGLAPPAHGDVVAAAVEAEGDGQRLDLLAPAERQVGPGRGGEEVAQVLGPHAARHTSHAASVGGPCGGPGPARPVPRRRTPVRVAAARRPLPRLRSKPARHSGCISVPGTTSPWERRPGCPHRPQPEPPHRRYHNMLRLQTPLDERYTAAPAGEL